jgi:thiosulfate dehydrogenase
VKLTYARLSLVLIAAGAATVIATVRRPLDAQALPKASAAAAAQLKSLTPTSQPIARTWTPPDMTKVPHSARGESILLGFHIFQETPKYAAAYAGNQVSCGNCHLQSGTLTGALPVVGVPAWFPQFSQRAKRDITLEDRIQECVTRSENGKPLPHDSTEMRALLDFFDWLPESQPAGQPAPVRGLAQLPADLKADAQHGEKIFADKCSDCHGTDGAGVPPILPPLWGPGAYNDGAGMNQPQKMAGFVLRNMPQNKPGSLSPQEALDVSTFIASKPHPAYNHDYDIY